MGGAVLIENSGNVTNCRFEDNSAEFGGAVSSDRTVNIADCNFTANRASVEGGAFYTGSCNIENSNFTNNIASNGRYSGDGGAVYINGNATVVNCDFIGNEAGVGSAIYFWNLHESKHVRSISHSTFLNNKANMDSIAPFTLTVNGTNIEIAFHGNNNLFNAILSRLKGDVNVTNVTYWGASGIENTGDSTIVPVMLYTQAGQNVTVRGVVDGVEVNITRSTDAEGKIVLENVREYNITVSHDEDSYYFSGKTFFTSRQLSLNMTDITTNDFTVNITAKSDIFEEYMSGEMIFRVDGQEFYASYAGNGTWWAEHTFNAYGEYKVNATYVGLDNVTINNGTITINKVNSTITLENIVLDYGETKNVTVTTTGATGITAKIDGNNVTVINNYTIPISGLGAGNYTLTVTTIPDDDHNPVTKEVNITVNKLSTEIILANETLDLKVGDEVTDLANLTPAGAGNLTFTSSNEDLVFVEDNVTIVANSQGQAIITVSFVGNENYTAAENKTITVNVALNDASVSVENDTLNLKADETCAINATIKPDTIMLKIKYTSSNESVATVDKNGIVTAVGEGRAIITLEVGDDEIYAKNSTTVTVTVSKINTTADVSIPENITVGDNSTVNVILPADATGNVTVKVDGEVVDTVPGANGTGSVKLPALDAGNHTAEIAYSGDDKYKPASKTATFNSGFSKVSS